MIRSTLSLDTDTLAAQIDFLEDYDDFAYDVFTEAVDDIRPDFLDELQYTPGKPTYPLRWASERQRIAVIIKLKKNNNLPYRRTGKLAAAWVIDVERNGSTFAMVVNNPAKAAAFVYGSLAQNKSSAIRFQQPFHQDTGWQPATDTVAFWQQALTERFTQDLELATQAAFRKRAFTRNR